MVIENHQFKKSIKLSLEYRFKHNWHKNITESNCYINYRIFKEDLNLEAYLSKLDLHERINLCKFRCSNSNIPIVAGRYNNIDFDNWLCNLCNREEIGDEFHYIMICPFFNEERKKHLNSSYWRIPNRSKFGYLFTSIDIKVLQNLAKFVKVIIDKFR